MDRAVDRAVDNSDALLERVHADLMRERFGPVVPVWELGTSPTPLAVARHRPFPVPTRTEWMDTPERIAERRRVLCAALD